MDWSQLSIGAIAGGIGTWLTGVLRLWVDHLLDQRKQLATEKRAIRAEQRDEDRKAADRERTNAERLKRDEGILLLHKTRLKGCVDLSKAALEVGEIHKYFEERPQCLTQPSARFLEKYPRDFHDQVCLAPHRFEPEEKTLSTLKCDVELMDLRTTAEGKVTS